jgi:TonB family protein
MVPAARATYHLAPSVQLPDALITVFIRPRIREAGDQASPTPGEGATVVLRIEVLESGDPGRIEIDASSGSQQVDQAAVDYARIQHWYAGRANGTPRPMWVRWGVRLQG